MRSLIILPLTAIIIFSSTILSNCQVKGLELFTSYNFQKKVFDCGFVVKEGQTNKLKDRVQFNSSCSFVVPTGSKFKIVNDKMPLLYNENYQGNLPVKWVVVSSLLSPSIDPIHDYHQVTPSLSPTGYYNDLFTGDTVILFSIESEFYYCTDEVRLYRNDKDVDLVPYDFKNGFSIGGVKQIYSGNAKVESSFKLNLPIADSSVYCHKDFVSIIDNSDGKFTFSDSSFLNLNPLPYYDKLRIKYEDKNSACIVEFEAVEIINPQLPVIEKVDFNLNEVITLPSVVNSDWYSMDNNIAYVDEKGSLVAMNPGQTFIGLKEKKNECHSPLLPIQVLQTTGFIDDDLNNIKAYPNPAQDIIKIFSDQEITGISIRDLLGNYISDIKNVKNLSKQGEYTIEISDLINGIYFLELSTIGKKVVKPLVKSK